MDSIFVVRQQWSNASDEQRRSIETALKQEVRLLRNLLKELQSRKRILADCLATVQTAAETGIQFLHEDSTLCECLNLQSACAYEISDLESLDPNVSVQSVIQMIAQKQNSQTEVQQWQEQGLLWKVNLLNEFHVQF